MESKHEQGCHWKEGEKKTYIPFSVLFHPTVIIPAFSNSIWSCIVVMKIIEHGSIVEIFKYYPAYKREKSLDRHYYKLHSKKWVEHAFESRLI